MISNVRRAALLCVLTLTAAVLATQAQVRRDASIVGTVRDAQSRLPIEGAVVTVVEVVTGATIIRSSRSNASGEYILELISGETELTVRTDGYAQETAKVTMGQGQQARKMDFSLLRAATLVARFSDAFGSGVSDAIIRVTYPGLIRPLEFDTRMIFTTNKNGTAVLGNLMPRVPVVLTVEHPDYLPFKSTPIILSPGEIRADVLIQLVSK